MVRRTSQTILRQMEIVMAGDSHQQRAWKIHQRLVNPPNAVNDTGIDLKRKRVPPEAPAKVKVEVNKVIPQQPEFHAKQKINFNTIMRAVADYYRISARTIVSTSRSNWAVIPRYAVVHLALKHSSQSSVALGY